MDPGRDLEETGRMRARSWLLAAAAALWLLPSPARAALFFFSIPLDGAQEVDAGGNPNQGDPDGSGTADLTLDTDTNTITWSITVADIDTVILAHIHEAPAGVNGPIRIDFNGMLTGSTTDPDVSLVAADPTGYYVNVHTVAFQAGAVRGQIPEPGTLALLGAGIALLAGRRSA
jgi:hypothetical protein